MPLPSSLRRTLLPVVVGVELVAIVFGAQYLSGGRFLGSTGGTGCVDVSVTEVDQNNNPISPMDPVEFVMDPAWGADWAHLPRTTTDKTGKGRISGVTPGAHHMSFRANNYIMTSNSLGGTSIQVPSGTPCASQHVGLKKEQVAGCDPEKDLTGSLGTNNGTVHNRSTKCSYQIGIASYKMYALNRIDDQTLFDSDSRTIGPGQSVTMSVDLPTCAYQLDQFYGHLIKTFSTGENYMSRLLGDRKQQDRPFCPTGPGVPPGGPGCVEVFKEVYAADRTTRINATAPFTFRLSNGATLTTPTGTQDPQVVFRNLPIGDYTVTEVLTPGYDRFFPASNSVTVHADGISDLGPPRTCEHVTFKNSVHPVASSSSAAPSSHSSTSSVSSAPASSSSSVSSTLITNFPYCRGSPIVVKYAYDGHAEPPYECASVCRDIEDCDHGAGKNGAQGDTCTSTCHWVANTCGDGKVGGTEECDDGKAVNGTAKSNCSTQCKSKTCSSGQICPNGKKCDPNGKCPSTNPVCGNGMLEKGEECDDGNLLDDTCSSTCTLPKTYQPSCGDGIVTRQDFRYILYSNGFGTQCGIDLCQDYGEDNCIICPVDPDVLAAYDRPAPDNIHIKCQIPPKCGNGHVDANEDCDDGADNGKQGKCPATCLRDDDGPPVCGDNELSNPPETCEDGNTTNHDGCSDQCQLENGCAVTCGDGIRTPGEECDDANTKNGDGCSSVCKREATYIPNCGNGVLDPTEQCDDGNANSGDGCSATCVNEKTAVCGDHIWQQGEQCDDGNKTDGDGCSRFCTHESPCGCGNGKVDPGEQCDDGNQDNGDSCSTLCKKTCTTNDECPSKVCLPTGDCADNTCGDGKKDAGEQCDDGAKNGTPGDACSATCHATCTPGATCPDGQICPANGECPSPSCGDGIIQSPEQCDLGATNGNANVNCNAQCKWKTCTVGTPCPDGQICPASGICPGPACGDGVIQAPEQCDLGSSNGASNANCDSACRLKTCTPGTSCPDGQVCPANGICPNPQCGDGVVQAPEQCDLGSRNGTSTANCNASCKLVACTPGTHCPDGQLCPPGGFCPVPTCGDSIIQPPEECDLGPSNGASNVNCDATCRQKDCSPGSICPDGQLCPANHNCPNPQCGDGVVQATGVDGRPGTADDEQCDHGAKNGDLGDTCSDSCKTVASQCGNGVLQVSLGEQCDHGSNNGKTGDTCSSTCTTITRPSCGDGHKDANEQCDDGNTNNTDACRNNCTLPTCSKDTDCVSGKCSGGVCVPDQCGDGVKNAEEQCDDGNNRNNDGCSAFCVLEPFTPRCGDNILSESAGEECEDGNTKNNDGCSSVCKLEPGPPTRCGDHIITHGEECDDGNLINGDGCSATCRLEGTGAPVCGNGKLEYGEFCDAGALNGKPGVNCTAQCAQVSPYESCGDGVVTAGEECDDGNVRGGDGCSSKCTLEPIPPTCGNGIRTLGEECDDGNTVDGDACSNRCKLGPDNPCGDSDQCESGLCQNGVCGSCTQNSQCGSNVCLDGKCLALCGNGAKDSDEFCDDGNLSNADGCTDYCRLGYGRECTTDYSCGSGLCKNGRCDICHRNDECAGGVCYQGSCLILPSDRSTELSIQPSPQDLSDALNADATKAHEAAVGKPAAGKTGPGEVLLFAALAAAAVVLWRASRKRS